MLEVGFTSSYRLHKYFLFFAETPRIWRRVTVSATIIPSQHSALSWIKSPDAAENACKILPGDLTSQLEQALTTKQLLETATMTSLIIVEHTTGNFSIDDAHADITEDVEEARMTGYRGYELPEIRAEWPSRTVAYPRVLLSGQCPGTIWILCRT